jgi:hypothetical protein
MRPARFPFACFVPERSSPSRVRCAAHQPRALDRSGPFRTLTHNKGKRANANLSQFAALCGLPLVGPELRDKFRVDKTS